MTVSGKRSMNAQSAIWNRVSWQRPTPQTPCSVHGNRNRRGLVTGATATDTGNLAAQIRFKIHITGDALRSSPSMRLPRHRDQLLRGEVDHDPPVRALKESPG